MSREGNLKGVERESLVVSEFAKMGWETFSGNGNTSCDLIALKQGVLLRVEVKGLGNKSKRPSGPYACIPKHRGSTFDCRECDILIRFNSKGDAFWQRSAAYKGESHGLPLREKMSIHTTKKNLSRALSMTEKTE
jgi:hypothetical protein